MERRTFLRTGTIGLAGIAGCLDGGTDQTDTDGNETSVDDTDAGRQSDGWPPELDEQPEERSIDTDSFERLTMDGQEVPLVPLNVAYYWYRRQEARYVDARGAGQYEALHITGAAHSPA